VPEVVHGAGGMDIRDGRFLVAGGLPEGAPVNHVYEYGANFRFVKRHLIRSGWTLMGIQTAAWHDGSWWFGCYGRPAEIVKTGPDFSMQGRPPFSCALGIAGIAPGAVLVATGPKTPDGRHRGVLHLAKADEGNGLRRVEE